MLKNNVIIDRWNDKWSEFVENQKLAILFASDDIVEEFFIHSKLDFKDDKVILTCEDKFLGLTYYKFKKQWQVTEIHNVPLGFSNGLSEVITPFKFGLFQFHMLHSNLFSELETAINFKKWDVDCVQMKNNHHQKYVEIKHRNGATIYVYSKENREARIQEQISLENDINNWEHHLNERYRNTFVDFDFNEKDSNFEYSFLSMPELMDITGLTKRKILSILRKKSYEPLYAIESIYLLKRYGCEGRYRDFVVAKVGGYPSLLLDKPNYQENEFEDFYIYEEAK